MRSHDERGWIGRPSAVTSIRQTPPGVATGSEAVVIQTSPPRPPVSGSRAAPITTPSACETHREWIEAQLRLGRNAQRIYQDLVERHRFIHGYESVKRFVARVKRRNPERFDVLEFLPAEEAQVDLGLGAPTLRRGKYRRPYLFVMTLKYSGKCFRKVVWKVDQETWSRLHEEAFRCFGGVTIYVVLDNLKQGVIRPDIYEPELNLIYAEMLRHYGVVADPCRVGDPNRKGSVERALKAFVPLRAEWLRALAAAVRSGGLAGLATEAPWATQAGRSASLSEMPGAVADDGVDPVAQAVRLLAEGMAPEHLAVALEALAEARADCDRAHDHVDLVWTGPEGSGTASRDTAVVVRELFGRVESRVLVAGYVVYSGREVFAALARRMEERPELRVRFFLDVERRKGDTSLASEIVKRFARRFHEVEWPGLRLPELYYDPRSLELDPDRREVLHAKCIVADGEIAFVSSANFTPAAQARNIEAGVLIRSRSLGASLESHFESLVGDGVLRRVGW